MNRMIIIFFLTIAANVCAGDDVPRISAHLIGQNYGKIDTTIVVAAEKQKVFHFHMDYEGGGTWYDAFLYMEGGDVTIVERDSMSNPYKAGHKVETVENIYRFAADKIGEDTIELRQGNRITLRRIPSSNRMGPSSDSNIRGQRR